MFIYCSIDHRVKGIKHIIFPKKHYPTELTEHLLKSYPDQSKNNHVQT